MISSDFSFYVIWRICLSITIILCVSVSYLLWGGGNSLARSISHWQIWRFHCICYIASLSLEGKNRCQGLVYMISISKRRDRFRRECAIYEEKKRRKKNMIFLRRRTFWFAKVSHHGIRITLRHQLINFETLLNNNNNNSRVYVLLKYFADLWTEPDR